MAGEWLVPGNVLGMQRGDLLIPKDGVGNGNPDDADTDG